MCCRWNYYCVNGFLAPHKRRPVIIHIPWTSVVLLDGGSPSSQHQILWLLGPCQCQAQFHPKQRLSHPRYRPRRPRSDPDSLICAEACKRHHQFPCRKQPVLSSAGWLSAVGLGPSRSADDIPADGGRKASLR